MNPVVPKISIVVPTYNAGAYLDSLLESLVEQSLVTFEVLLLDDASKDDSLQRMEKYAADERVRIFQWESNRGAHAGTLFLLTEIRGEFWCYPGADDYFEPNFLEERLKWIEKHPNVALVHGRAGYVDEHGLKIDDPNPPMNTPELMRGDDLLLALLEHNFINAPSVIVRSSFTKTILPFFTGAVFYPMDWYLWILLAALGFDFRYDDRALHAYRIHSASNSLTPEKLAVRRAECRLTPLLALSKASGYSDHAAVLWSRWGRTLYAAWLLRALVVSKSRRFDFAWLRLAAQACRRQPQGRFFPLFDYVRNGLAIVMTAYRERKARSKQRLSVSGLAQIRHPMFEKLP